MGKPKASEPKEADRKGKSKAERLSPVPCVDFKGSVTPDYKTIYFLTSS